METTTEAREQSEARTRADHVLRLVRWRLTSDQRLKRLAMHVGGFREVEQEVFVNLLKRVQPDNVRFSTWVLNNLKWTVFEMVCRKKRAQRSDIHKPLVYSCNLSSELERLELQRDVSSAMRLVASERDETIMLLWAKGTSTQEIAQAYAITTARVNQLVRRTIDRIKKPDISGQLVGHCD